MKRLFSLGLLCILYSFVNAQAPVLLKNINPNTTDQYSHSFPNNGIVFNGYLYFTAENYNGRELWRTKGTASSTVITRDAESIYETQSSNPRLFTIFGNNLYFFGDNKKLYKVDGATNDVIELAQLNEGNDPVEMVAFGDRLIIAGVHSLSDGEELLFFDTTYNYFNIIYDINPGSDSSKPRNLTVMDNVLYFSADDGTNGRELWKYDGFSNPKMVLDINPNGSDGSDPHDFMVFDGILYFTATDSTHGFELWQSEGNNFDTYMVDDLNQEDNGNGGTLSSNPDRKVIFDNTLYFSADDGLDGNELWSYDGSSFYEVADINFGGDSDPGKFGFKEMNGYLYFAANSGLDNYELWRTNGSGANEISNINQFAGSNPQDMVVVGDTLYFIADDGNNGYELWRSNGISTNTQIVKDIQPINYDNPHIFGVFNHRVYFYANDNLIGSEPYTSDGTMAGTTLLKDINIAFPYGIGSDPLPLLIFNGTNYFGARAGTNQNNSLFKTNGTEVGTVAVKESTPVDYFSANTYAAKVAGSLLFFSGYETTNGTELWTTDGTLANTQLVKDINPGISSSDMDRVIALNNKIIFTAEDGTHGRELWVSDGTNAGTFMLQDIKAGSEGTNFEEFVLFNDKIYFSADDGTHGKELWVTDGSVVGTIMLKDIQTGSVGSGPQGMKAIGSYLYFRADDGIVGSEMWRTDGTAGNTILFKDINVGPGHSAPDAFAELNGYIYFGADDGSGSKLWRSNGTIGDASPFYNVGYPFYLTKVGSRLVFIALPSNAKGFELWATDGVSTTEQLEDFTSGTQNGLGYFFIDNFPVYQNKWFFWAPTPHGGQELWQTDGTVAGTFSYDMAPGALSSYPRAYIGTDALYVVASNGSNIGREMYRLDVCGTDPNQTTWVGKIDNDWTNINNWCGGLPDATKDVFINASTPNQPVLPVGTHAVKGIYIPANDTLKLGSATLEIYGTVSGEGTFKGGPNAELVIKGSGAAGTLYFTQLTDGTSNALKNFTFNRSSGSAILGNKLVITGVYNPTSGTLNSNGNLVLRSNAAGTARIAEGSSAGDYISGEVTVERFIPAGKRAYRQLSGGVNSTSPIHSNWQNGGTYIPGVGMHITGNQSGLNGFDQTLSGAANVFTYTPGNPTFTPIPNTDATNLKALQGYRVFIFGDRNSNLTIENNTGMGTANIALNSNVTLKSSGFLATGTVTFNSTTGATANGSTDGTIKLGAIANQFALIANPYWSPVDWNELNKTDVIPTYWVWDPAIGNRGAYVSWTTGSGSSGGSITKDIQPGQAIFIRNDVSIPSGPSITFEEADKSSGFTNTFRGSNETPSKMRIYLYTNTALASNGSMQDGATVAFRDDFSSVVDNFDATKFTNTDENIAIVRGASVLGLEARPTVTAADTIPLRIWKLYSNNQYTLKFDGMDFDAGITGILVDKKLNQEHVLNMSGNITLPFTFTASDSSSYYDRFMLVFRPSATLPVHFTQVKAYQKNAGIQVEWNVAAEVDVVKYEVEKSTNGTVFDKVGTVTANNSKAYNWYDAMPNNGNNFYRIKVTNKDNTTSYSNVVNVKLGNTKGDIVSVYPNPIKGNVLNVQFNNLEKGTYTVQLFNQTGQQVFSRSMSTDGGNMNEAMQLNKLSAGVYNMVVTGAQGIISTQKIVKEN